MLKQRRFRATHVNRIFKDLGATKFVSLSVYSYRDDLPENAS